MARLRYLADTSVFSRLSKPNVAAAFGPRATAGQIGLCPPVAFELGYSARNHDDYVTLSERLSAYPAVPVTAADHERALDVQRLLSAKGQHRVLSLVDAPARSSRGSTRPDDSALRRGLRSCRRRHRSTT